ncbi:geranylgeranylglyceryl/heptaprenylglyceryl phosphate synthase, partial [Planctomycetota bacterium]
LAAPSTTESRLHAMAQSGSGFLYYVSRYGVTGARSGVPSELEREVARARRIVGRPVAVGFGISSPETAASVARYADGVVVGSALVAHIERDGEGAGPALAALARDLADAVHGVG